MNTAHSPPRELQKPLKHAYFGYPMFWSSLFPDTINQLYAKRRATESAVHCRNAEMASCRAHHNNNKSTTVKQIAQTDAHCNRAGKTGVLWASLIDCGRCFPTRAARRASCGVRGQLRSMHRSLAAPALRLTQRGSRRPTARAPAPPSCPPFNRRDLYTISCIGESPWYNCGFQLVSACLHARGLSNQQSSTPRDGS